MPAPQFHHPGLRGPVHAKVGALTRIRPYPNDCALQLKG
jgi:hypothetical protein